ncbi:ATPase [bacterium]|nr:ATPase [bacterium]
MGRTKNQIIDETTDAYIESLDLDNLPSPEDIAIQLTQQIEDQIILENQLRSKGTGFRIPDSLSFDQIATLMSIMYPIARISCAGANADTEYDLLAMYQSDGPDEGIYVTSEEELYKIARRFNRRLSSREFDEVVKVLRTIVPRKLRCMDRDMIAVNNGIFNYETKILEPFSPDIVFMTKSHVNYNPAATNITIHNDDDDTDWDIESWMSDLSDDPEIVELLWQILGAIIRPHVRWNKSAWLYSESGNNGKGTLCELMRSLCGDTAYAAIPICDFSKDFALEPLTRSTAIIVDENDVGTFIDKAANLKAVITNDVISINRKFKTPISYQFYGFMVQCLNEFPRIKDKSDSFYRRQLFIPFDKCFTGKERKYIKEDYLHREEVLEYVLYKVLHMNFYTLSEPAGCIAVLTEYKEFNDPVRQFFEDVQDQFKWDLLPFSFLYELYKSWFRKNSPTGSIQGKNKFINELLNIIKTGQRWYCMDKSKTIRSAGKMIGPEPLIVEYDLVDWRNPTYSGGDTDRVCCPKLQDYYRGILRFSTSDIPMTDDDADATDATDDATLINDGGEIDEDTD